MKISELINELALLGSLHGDLDVYRKDYDRIGDVLYIETEPPTFDGEDVIL